jgi:hypothetical protein
MDRRLALHVVAARPAGHHRKELIRQHGERRLCRADGHSSGADTRVRLGARETNRRLVSVAAYNGTYYVYFTIQGPDRADAAATEIATGLVRDTLKKLTT